MTEKNELPELNNALADFDPKRREALRKLVVGAAFAVPAVMSFSVDGMLMSSAAAEPEPTNQISS